MIKKYYKKEALVLLLAIGYSLFAILPVSAADPVARSGLVPCVGPGGGSTGGNVCDACYFLKMITDILNFIVKIVIAPLAGLLALAGGIMMVLGGGYEKWRTRGKEILKNTAIGVLIILSSWVIVNTLITKFGVRVEGFDPVNWYTVECLTPIPAAGAPAADGAPAREYQWTAVPYNKYCRDVLGEGWRNVDGTYCQGNSPGLTYECCGKF